MENHIAFHLGEKLVSHNKELPVKEQQKVEQILYIMDKFCIGEATYHAALEAGTYQGLTSSKNAKKISTSSYILKEHQGNQMVQHLTFVMS